MEVLRGPASEQGHKETVSGGKGRVKELEQLMGVHFGVQ